MLSVQKQIMESFVRVLVFLAANPTTGAASYGKAKEALEGAVSQLRTYAGAQEHGRELSVAEQRRLDKLAARIVTRHMRPIVTIAKSEVNLESDPRVAEALRLPPTAIGITKFIAAATAMIETARKFESVFTANGRPDDFIAQFRGAVDELAEAQAGRALVVNTKIGATAGLRAQLRRGRLAVARLDALVRIAFEENEVVLSQWRAAKRVQALPGAPSDPGTQKVA